jgi:hypothetical protein
MIVCISQYVKCMHGTDIRDLHSLGRWNNLHSLGQCARMNTLNGVFIYLVLAVLATLLSLAALLSLVALLVALLGVLSRVLLGLLATSNGSSPTASAFAASTYCGKVVSAGVWLDWF